MTRLLNFTALLLILFVAVVVLRRPQDRRSRGEPEGGGQASLVQGREPPDSAVKVVTNALGIQLVRVKAGEYLMGSPPGVTGRRENEKQHRVQVGRGFYLGRFEITVAQFRQFVEQAKYKTDAERDPLGSYGFDTSTGDHLRHPRFNWRNLGVKQGDDHPVANISWNDATAYCRWLTRSTGQNYRLPTEIEWEYACRAGSKAAFHTGATPQGGGNVADQSLRKVFGGFAWCTSWDDGHAFTAPVGSFRPNAFGLHDMHGNVMEWCHDRHDLYGSRMGPLEHRGGESVRSKKSAGEGPPKPRKADGPFRVCRGGAWGSRVTRSTASYREVQLTASWRGYYSGFRVLCSDDAIREKPVAQ